MTENRVQPITEQLTIHFDQLKYDENCSAENRALREKAYAVFQQLGFPTIQDEEWKFTNVAPFLKDAYALEITDIEAVNLNELSQLVNGHLESVQQALKGEPKGAYRIVVVNGSINKDLSVLPSEDEVQILQIQQATQEAKFNTYFGKVAQYDKNAFVALNTALYQNGFYVYVKKGKAVDKPIHIVNVYWSAQAAWLQPRQLVVVGEQAEVTIIETEIAQNTGTPFFINGVKEWIVENGGHCDHYEIQKGEKGLRNIQRTEVVQLKDTVYSNYTFTFPGSDLNRNNLIIHLDAANLESHLYGLYLPAQQQLVDNHTEVHHKHPHCDSTQLYKGVMLEQSKAVFNGKIFVYEDAQKTNAFQKSNNILMSDKATIHAKPQLEIFADDVKCSHGSTIGQLSEEAVFYLRSRGISESSSRNMMVNAFAIDVSEKVKIQGLRNYLESQIRETMYAQLEK